MGQTDLYICITFEHFGDYFSLIEYWTEPCGHVPLLGTRPCPHVDIWIKQGSNITNVGHYLRSDQYQHVDNICKSKNKWEIKMKMFFFVDFRGVKWERDKDVRLIIGRKSPLTLKLVYCWSLFIWAIPKHGSYFNLPARAQPGLFIIVSLPDERWQSMQSWIWCLLASISIAF